MYLPLALNELQLMIVWMKLRYRCVNIVYSFHYKSREKTKQLLY